MKIMIVDSSATGWKRVGNLLEGVGDLELTGGDVQGDDPVGAIGRVKPDILILDVDMPEGTGIRLLRRIRGAYAGLAIIVLTGAACPVFRKTCMEAGARYFFDKATEFDKVAGAVESLQQSTHQSPESISKENMQ